MVGIEVKVPLVYCEENLREAASVKLGEEYSGTVTVLRRELDTSAQKAQYKLRVGVTLDPYTETRLCKKGLARSCPSLELSFPQTNITSRPIVVGSGPCGLFAALALAESGACPIILERGSDVDTRQKKVESFEKGGALDTECNIQFGEGGAGTFSDGKLKHGATDAYVYKVLSEFVGCGAPEEILYDAAPHVGTDLLTGIVKKLREKIISLGGEIFFDSKVDRLIVKEGKLCGVEFVCGTKRKELFSDCVVLAIGHSARDTFRMLDGAGVRMQARGFGIGVRIEHPRKYIDRLIYGSHSEEIESAASYHFVTHLKGGRSVYSFCMCPGGSVVAAASEQEAVVTNGMSRHARNGENSNAAFLVSVTPEDFGNDPIKGMELQKAIEGKAFSLSGDFKAPCVRMEDFVQNRSTKCFGDVLPTYPRGTVFAHSNEFLPQFIELSLKEAINDFDQYRKGFYFPDALLTGVETRTTSPVRIMRDETRESETLRGLFPCGEGAGYSGGIVSSAVDGLKTAEAIINKFKK